ncbi:MAG: DUF6491 family protein [Pseudomonadota bacterium]|nr:DUF6491 family protein [Pseudomonadota bacterium]
MPVSWQVAEAFWGRIIGHERSYPCQEIDMKRPSIVLLILSVAALGSGCVTDGGVRDADRLAMYQAHAGAPLKNIHYNHHPVGWEDVDDEHLLLTMTPRNVYLMKLSGPCLDYDAGSPVLVISSQAGRVSTGFDRITIGDPRFSCRIEEIREVDVVSMRKARDGAGSG